MAATYGVDLVFKTLGDGKLKTVGNQLKGIDVTARKLSGASPFKGVSRSATVASASVGKLNAAMSQGAAASFGSSMANTAAGLTSVSAAAKAGAAATTVLAGTQATAAASGASLASSLLKANKSSTYLNQTTTLLHTTQQAMQNTTDKSSDRFKRLATQSQSLQKVLETLTLGQEEYLQGLKDLPPAADRAARGQKRLEGSLKPSKFKTAGNAVSGFGAKVKGLAGSFSLLKGAIAGVGLGLIARTLFNASAEFERYEKQLTTLTGSSTKAKAVIEQLNDINRKSPFDLPQLIRTSKTLSAMNIEYSKLVKTTERLGKVSAATGARVEDVALAYGQVASKGKLQTEELYQFQERGIPLAKELTRMLGLQQGELEKLIQSGKVGFPLVEKAFENMTEASGQFKDAFNNTADTLDARLSNAKSDFKAAAKALGDAFRPVFTWMLTQTSKIFNALTGLVERLRRGGVATAQAEIQAGNQAADFIGSKYGAKGRAAIISPFNNPIKDEFLKLRKVFLESAIDDLNVAAGLTDRAVKGNLASQGPSAASKAEIEANKKLLLGGNNQNGGNDIAAATGRQLMGRVIELLTGDKSSQFYRADHGGQNYHVHVAFETQEQKELAKALLQSKGIQIGSENDGRHAPGSYHYSNQAFDIPASQVPVGQEDALSQQVLDILGQEFGGLVGGDGNVVEQLFADARVEQAALLEEGRQGMESLIAQTEQGTQAFNDMYDNSKLRDRLELEGMSSELIGIQVTRSDRLRDIKRSQIEAVTALNKLYAAGKITEDQKLTTEQQITAEYQKQAGAVNNLATDDAARAVKNQQAEVTKLDELYGSVASRINTGIVDGIIAAVDGSKDLQEVLSDVLKDLGKMFLQFGMNMAFKGLSLPGFAGGGYTGDGSRSGGVDGQGGFPAILHPQETVIDHTKGMNRWSSANQAGGAVGGAEGEGAAGASAGGMTTTVNYTGPTLNFSGDDYLPKSAAGDLIATAAREGAKQGEAMAIRKLQMSPATRRRLGL